VLAVEFLLINNLPEQCILGSRERDGRVLFLEKDGGEGKA